VRRLVGAGVDFVVVGAVAVIVHASPRLTNDLDICYSPERDNLARLGSVLVELEARLRGIEEDLPFVPDTRTLWGTQLLCLSTALGNLDLLLRPEGAPEYRTLRARAERIDLNGVSVLVASIDDMIAMKQAAGRPQDQIDLEALQVARRRQPAGS
jgi:hypothetical protein